MRDHHLGHPKTPRSRRTITIAPTVAALLEKRIDGRPADDFVFTSRTGLPLHNGDFYTHIWRKLMTAVAAEGLAPFRFHDLRHTHACKVAEGASLSVVYAWPAADRRVRKRQPARLSLQLRAAVATSAERGDTRC